MAVAAIVEEVTVVSEFELPPLEADRANPARMYDFYLGGYHNFAVDRQAARAAESVWPGTARCAQANRSFLHRVVRFLISQGIDQFLDLGSGVPTVGNVHEIAQRADPDARVVYVDIEPVAVKTSELLLADNPNAITVHADLRETDSVLGDRRVRQMLDFSRPIAIMFIDVLPFVSDDDDPVSIVRTYLDAAVPGSYVAISQYDDSVMELEGAEDLEQVYAREAYPFFVRSLPRINELFDAAELVPPGLVHALDWRPDDDHTLDEFRSRIPLYVGVARKR